MYMNVCVHAGVCLLYMCVLYMRIYIWENILCENSEEFGETVT